MSISLSSSPPPPRNNNLSRLLSLAWWLAIVLALAVLLASLPGYAAWAFTSADIFGGPVPDYGLAFDLTSAAASLGIAILSVGLAILLYARRRDDAVAVYVSLYLLAHGIVFSGPLEMLAAELEPVAAWSDYALRLQAALVTTPTVLLLAIFPNGRLAPRWMRLILIASLPLSVLVLFTAPNWWISHDSARAVAMSTWMAAVMIPSAYAQLYRYRHVSTAAERQQTKWFVLGLLVWFVLLALLSIPYASLLRLPDDAPRPWWLPLNTLLWWLSLGIMPLSLTLAVLRYRLWDIDLLIRRTLVYSLVTAVVVAAYYGGVIGLGSLVRSLTGQASSPLVTVLTTLVLAGAFAPLRRRAQAFIDRRFYRRRYNAAQTLAAFNAVARDQVDLDQLSTTLVATVSATMQPAGVSLWLRQREDAPANPTA